MNARIFYELDCIFEIKMMKNDWSRKACRLHSNRLNRTGTDKQLLNAHYSAYETSFVKQQPKE